MKRLVLTHLGGMPFEQEDLKYLQDATKEEIMAAIGAFKNPSDAWMIVSGCVASDAGLGDVAVSAGWVIFGGELGYYAGSIIADTAGNFPTPEFDTDVLVDAAGTEVFEDGTTHDTYLNTRIILIGTGSALNQAQYIAAINGFPRIQNYFHSAVMESWKIPVCHASAVNPGYPGSVSFRYRKSGFKRIELNGAIQFAPGVPMFTILCNLPVGYRPDVERNLFIMVRGLTDPLDNIGNAFSQLIVKTNGDVVIHGHPTDSTHYFFDGVSFELESL